MTSNKERNNHLSVAYFKNSHGVIIPVYTPEQLTELAQKDSFQQVTQDEYQKQQEERLQSLVKQKRIDKKQQDNTIAVLPPHQSDLIG